MTGALIPLSFSQRDLLRIFRQQGPNAMNNMAITLRLHGPLDRGALSRAIDDVLLRHEPLRTMFARTNGVDHQSIVPGVPDAARMREVDARAQDVPELVAAEYRRPFDPTVEVPIRVRLLNIGAEEHVLCVVLHHITADGWSLRVLCEDLGVAYAARRKGAEPGWSPLEIRYRDYAYWQHEVLGDEEDPASLAHRQLAHWRAALDGVPEELALPFDRPRPETPSYRGAQVDASLDSRVHGRLLELARAADVTLFMIAHAAVCTMLARHGAGTDILLASVMSGRTEPALEPLVGNFINGLILRTDLSGDPTFRELLDRVRAADLAAYEHADLAIDRVRGLLPRAPQLLIAFDTGGAEKLELEGLVVEPEPIMASGAKRDLSFHFLDNYHLDGTPAGITGGIEYAADLFDEATARMLAADLRRLFVLFSEKPDIRCLSEGGLSR